MINVVIFGPPGAGKGTQSEKIIEKYGFKHISTGDLLRKEIASGSELGKKISERIDKGKLVSDELITDILINELDRIGKVPGVIFDGFPRTVSQAEDLDRILADRDTGVSVMLDLEVDEEELIKRLLHRAKVEGRADDTIDVIKNRLKIYHKKTEPVIDYYKKEGKFRKIDGSGTVGDIFARIDNVLKAL
jgi:adenylate kinase